MKKRVAKFVGIDRWNRPVFRDDAGIYYCLIDILFGSSEEVTIEKCAGYKIIEKGRSFDGEPGFPVSGVELAFGSK